MTSLSHVRGQPVRLCFQVCLWCLNFSLNKCCHITNELVMSRVQIPRQRGNINFPNICMINFSIILENLFFSPNILQKLGWVLTICSITELIWICMVWEFRSIRRMSTAEHWWWKERFCWENVLSRKTRTTENAEPYVKTIIIVCHSLKICVWMVESNLQLFFVCVDRLSNFRKSLSQGIQTLTCLYG